ncbi:RING-H2 finger protein ATL3-like [Vicia villosa]|uniref:RING-H2 finger protein ATL3-like n=1 Tax=Vicia villosa TaxID=3911 RepID=UPI00273AB115|nr:RING-H2 finger protein ATL3-like [Vicia villosa]
MTDLSPTADNLGQSTAVDITGKIMVVIIIILFFFVVTFLFFHLFAKGFWWSHDSQADNNSQSRRRRRGQQAAVLGEGGLDPLILNSLPVTVFNSEKDGLDLECSVCLAELVEGEKVRVLPKCNHRFHIDCIDMWFQSHSTCPLCRTTLAPTTPSSQVVEIEPSSAAFPTNVLIWGNHDQTVSSTTTSSEQNTCSSSSSSSEGTSDDGMLRIDIPNDSEATTSSSSPTAGGGRLRSLKRLLSNSRLNPWSPTAAAATTSLQQQTKPKESAAQHS